MSAGFNHLAVNVALTPGATVLTNILAAGQTGVIKAVYITISIGAAAGSSIGVQLKDAAGAANIFFGRVNNVGGAAVYQFTGQMTSVPITEIPFANGLAINIASPAAGDWGNVMASIDYYQ